MPMAGSTGSTSPAGKPGPILEGGVLGPCPKEAVRAGCDLKAPVAAEAVRRIDRLFAVERDIGGLSAEHAWLRDGSARHRSG